MRDRIETDEMFASALLQNFYNLKIYYEMLGTDQTPESWQLNCWVNLATEIEEYLFAAVNKISRAEAKERLQTISKLGFIPLVAHLRVAAFVLRETGSQKAKPTLWEATLKEPLWYYSSPDAVTWFMAAAELDLAGVLEILMVLHPNRVLENEALAKLAKVRRRLT